MRFLGRRTGVDYILVIPAITNSSKNSASCVTERFYFLRANMQKFRSLFLPFTIVATMLSLSCPGIAQVDRSGLTGTVTDPSGKLLGQTHITVVENSTQLRSVKGCQTTREDMISPSFQWGNTPSSSIIPAFRL